MTWYRAGPELACGVAAGAAGWTGWLAGVTLSGRVHADFRERRRALGVALCDVFTAGFMLDTFLAICLQNLSATSRDAQTASRHAAPLATSFNVTSARSTPRVCKCVTTLLVRVGMPHRKRETVPSCCGGVVGTLAGEPAVVAGVVEGLVGAVTGRFNGFHKSSSAVRRFAAFSSACFRNRSWTRPDLASLATTAVTAARRRATRLSTLRSGSKRQEPLAATTMS